MTQANKVNKEGEYNNNNKELDYIYEECNCCRKHMMNEKYIWVGIKDDLYYCQSCVGIYEIDAVRCRDI